MNCFVFSSGQLKQGITLLYFIGVVLFFSPLSVPYKTVFPLAFLTMCSLCCSCWPMTLAMCFSAIGDWMGVCHNFWGQMGAFACAHLAFIVYFYPTLQFKRVGLKWGLVTLYGLLAGVCIVPHVQGYLQMGVVVYLILILLMCGMAWMQQNSYYAVGAWLFVISDTVLAWNKFVSPIEWVGYLIMIPYYLGQWTLFIQSVRQPEKK